MGDDYDCNGKIYTAVFYFDDINGVGMSAFRNAVLSVVCFWDFIMYDIMIK